MKNERSTTYQDSILRIDDGTLTIKRYFFPIGTKRIDLAQIVGVKEYRMNKLTGKGRIWGSGDFRHWLPLDLRRRNKQQAFVIDVGRRSKPVLTPDDPDAFRAALARAGVPLSRR
jgi:hypothetical protein